MTTTDEQFQAMREKAEAERIAEHTERAIAAHMPPRYRDAKVEHQGVAEWVKGYRDGNTEGLLITGPTGVGKTFQGYAALGECIRADFELRRLTRNTDWRGGSVPTLLDQCRPGREPTITYDWGEAPQKVDVAAQMVAATVLLLDDLGAEKPSDWTGEILYRVIDERYMNLRPTIVVSNVPPRELAATIGDRLASRLTEMCKTVVMKGDDRRRQR